MPIATATSRVGAFLVAWNQEPFLFFIKITDAIMAAGTQLPSRDK